MLVAQGNLPDALTSFRGGLAIRDRPAKADPNDADWQRDLMVSYDSIRNVLLAQGNLPEALTSFRAKVSPPASVQQRKSARCEFKTRRIDLRRDRIKHSAVDAL